MRLALALSFCLLATPVFAQPPVATPVTPPPAVRDYLPRPQAAPRPAVRLINDVVYETIDGEKLMLDVAIPREGDGPFPLIIGLHGGAWKAGSRKDLSRGVIWADFGTGGGSLIESLAAKGYVAASVSYRLAPKSKFPAQIQDVKTAVRFLRANAKTYKIDPGRVGVIGFSAGGHLAALMGTTADPKFAGDQYPEFSSKVDCVVDFFGPADLTLYTETPGIEASFMVPWLGESSADHMEVYVDASPVSHAGKGSVPFLILHGTADIVVPMIHSKRLHAKLTEAGVESELVPVRFKGHGWFGEEARDSFARTVKFFDHHLKGQ